MIVTRVPFSGLEFTSNSALAFSFSDCAISAPSFPRFGHISPGGRPTPSSAMVTRHPSPSTMLCSVILPPSRPTKACLSALVSNSLTTSPVGMATLMDTG